MKYNNEIIAFFKKHNMYSDKMFDYLQNNTIMINYNYKENRDFIGCYHIIQNNKLNKIKLITPYPTNEITTLINIHEITHGIELYKHLNKKYTPDISCEVLPMLYERIYVNEVNSKELLEYAANLDKEITNQEQYLLGLNLRDELLNNYNYNFNSTKRKVKKLVNKYYK